ncbi:MAG: Fic family protein [Bacteroidetes bacterium]|nr:Fic family protein [Bacteroidota bacterium]
MRITDLKYYRAWQAAVDFDLAAKFDSIDFSDEAIDAGYRMQASAVFSSNIEGNPVDLNSFMNSVTGKKNFKPRKEIEEIEDLVSAYEFARDNDLNEKNLLKAHKILSRTILIRDKQGKYRTERMGVFEPTGLVFLAIEPQFVKGKMKELFEDVDELLSKNLSIAEVFYHASLLHLKFVHIHPFWDGNGRAARLLEKWFLLQKLNGRAWKIQSERFYKDNLATYYASINLGADYYALNYDNCIPFLLHLVNSIK